jgi:hypothetical protein
MFGSRNIWHTTPGQNTQLAGTPGHEDAGRKDRTTRYQFILGVLPSWMKGASKQGLQGGQQAIQAMKLSIRASTSTFLLEGDNSAALSF